MHSLRTVTLYFLVSLALGACAYSVESSNQDISFVTPGAEDAVCYVNVNDVKYKIYPPHTLNIKKSDEDMIVTCHAPGNRTREIDVPATRTERALWGTPVGVAWDYASQSMHYYPSVIAIDFSKEELVPNKLPKHNNADIKQPEEYDLEEFLPASPRLNSDKNAVRSPLLRKDDMYSDQSFETLEFMEDDMGGAPEGGKGDLKDVIENLTSEEPSSGGAEGEPVSLYPGQ